MAVEDVAKFTERTESDGATEALTRSVLKLVHLDPS